MTTKEYLQQIRHIKYTLRMLNEQRDEIHSAMYSLGSPSGKLSHDRVNTSISDDKLERLYVRVSAIEKRIIAETERLIKTQDKICRQIAKMENDQQRYVLFSRYVECCKWEVIAERMDITVRYVNMVHGRALQEFEKIRKK